eukprot:5900775-Prymnesium_polylepis.1
MMWDPRADRASRVESSAVGVLRRAACHGDAFGSFPFAARHGAVVLGGVARLAVRLVDAEALAQ